MGPPIPASRLTEKPCESQLSLLRRSHTLGGSDHSHQAVSWEIANPGVDPLNHAGAVYGVLDLAIRTSMSTICQWTGKQITLARHQGSTCLGIRSWELALRVVLQNTAFELTTGLASETPDGSRPRCFESS